MSSLSDEPDHIKRIRATQEKYRKDKVKPLRWRTGPVPEHIVVFYEWKCAAHGIGYGLSNGNIMDNEEILHSKCRWLPLRAILELIGE